MAAPSPPNPVGSPVEYERLRRDLDVDCETLDDIEAELLFQEAWEAFPYSTAKRRAYTRVLAIRSLLPGGVRSGRYVQNNSTEDMSKLFDNLRAWLDVWLGTLASAQDVPEEPVTTPSVAIFRCAPGVRGRVPGREGASWL